MNNLNSIKEKVSDLLRKIIRLLIERKEVAVLVSLGIVLLVLLTVVVLPNTQQNIRIKESDALIATSYQDIKNVKIITYGELEKTILKEKDITLALVDPNDPYYEPFVTSLKEESKMSEYVGKLYVYPMIYDKEKVTDFYKLKAGITLIHFVDHQETERTILDSQKEIELYLVDHLNSFIRPSSKELEEAEKAKTEKDTAQAAEDKEVIDELKDTPADDLAGEDEQADAPQE